MSATSKKRRVAPHGTRKDLREQFLKLEALVVRLEAEGQVATAASTRRKAAEVKERYRALYGYRG